MSKTLKPNGELIKLDQHNIHIYRKGPKDKPKIIFMSGSGTVSPVYDFKILYEKLQDDFRIIVIEKIGYGYSDICDYPCDIDSVITMYKKVLSVVEEDGPYILAAHSMSGLEALRWKQIFPDDICAIIGLDMAIPSVYQSWTTKELKKRIKLMKMVKKLKFHKLPFLFWGNHSALTKEERKQLILLKNRNSFNKCFINEANEVLSNANIVAKEKIECPALLFSSNGKQTSKNWIEHQKTFAKNINGKLICFDCGHYLHHFKSQEINIVINHFIDELKC